MKKRAQRILALVVCLAMCLSLMPAQLAFAEETVEPIVEEADCIEPSEAFSESLTDESEEAEEASEELPEEILAEIVTDDPVEGPIEEPFEEPIEEPEEESEDAESAEVSEDDLRTEEEKLRDAIEEGDAEYRITESITLSHDLTVEAESIYALTTDQDSVSITVPEGITLYVNGTLDICTGVSIDAGAEGAAVVVNGTVCLKGGCLSCAQGFGGSGKVFIDLDLCENAEESVTGCDVSSVYVNATVGTEQQLADILSGFAAYAGIGITLEENAVITLSGDMELASSVSVTLDKANSAIIVPDAMTLTNNGSITVSNAAAQVLVEVGGRLVNNGSAISENGGQILIEGEKNGNDLTFAGSIESEEQLRYAIANAQSTDVVCIEAKLEVSGELVIPENVTVAVENLLTVKGKLTVNGLLSVSGTLNAEGGLVINGKLDNSGAVTAGTELTVNACLVMGGTVEAVSPETLSTPITIADTSEILIKGGCFITNGNTVNIGENVKVSVDLSIAPESVMNVFGDIPTQTVTAAGTADSYAKLENACGLCSGFGKVICTLSGDISVTGDAVISENMSLDFANGRLLVDGGALVNNGGTLADGENTEPGDRSYIIVDCDKFEDIQDSGACISGIGDGWVTYFAGLSSYYDYLTLQKLALPAASPKAIELTGTLIVPAYKTVTVPDNTFFRVSTGKVVVNAKAALEIAEDALLELRGSGSLVCTDGYRVVNSGTIKADSIANVVFSGKGTLIGKLPEFGDATVVYSEEELKQALKSSADKIIIGENITLTNLLSIQAGKTVYAFRDLIVPDGGMLSVSGKLVLTGGTVHIESGAMYMSMTTGTPDGAISVSTSSYSTINEALAAISISPEATVLSSNGPCAFIITDVSDAEGLKAAAELPTGRYAKYIYVNSSILLDEAVTIDKLTYVFFADGCGISGSGSLVNKGFIHIYRRRDIDLSFVNSGTLETVSRESVVSAEEQLREALAEDEKYIFVRESILLTADLTVPDGKIVVLCSGSEIDLNGFRVFGELYEEVTATLHEDGGYRRVSDGVYDELDYSPAYSKREGQWKVNLNYIETQELFWNDPVIYGSEITLPEASAVINPENEAAYRFAGWVLMRSDNAVWDGEQFTDAASAGDFRLLPGDKVSFNGDWLAGIADKAVTVNDDGFLVTGNNRDAFVYYISADWRKQTEVIFFPGSIGENGEEIVGNVSCTSRFYDVGSLFTDLPVPVASGYEFVGWTFEDNTSVTEETTVPDSDMITLYASWNTLADLIIAQGEGWSLTRSGILSITTQDAIDKHEWTQSNASLVKYVVFDPGEENTISVISANAFAGCSSLAEIDLSGIAELGEGAFAASGLESIVVPKDVSVIPEKCFEGCTSLASVTLKCMDSGSIGSSAFAGCTALKSIDLSGFTTIGEAAFNGCTALAEVNFANDTILGIIAFNGCTKLKTIRFSGSEESWKQFINELPEGNDVIKKLKAQTIRDADSVTISVDKSVVYNNHIYVGVGHSVRLSAVCNPKNAWPITIRWKANNPLLSKDCISVDSDGVLTGLRAYDHEESVSVTASVDRYGLKFDRKYVIVKDYSVDITGEDVVEAGSKVTLAAQWHDKTSSYPETTIVWRMADGDSQYASVNAKGLVTTKAVTQTRVITVIAEAKNGQGGGEHKITLVPQISKITLQDDNGYPITGTVRINIRNGESSFDFRAVTDPIDASSNLTVPLPNKLAFVSDYYNLEGMGIHLMSVDYCGGRAVGKTSMKFASPNGKASATLNVEYVDLPTEIVIGDIKPTVGTVTLCAYDKDQLDNPKAKPIPTKDLKWSIEGAELYPFAALKGDKLTLKAIQEPVTLVVRAELAGIPETYAEKAIVFYPRMSLLSLTDMTGKSTLNGTTMFIDGEAGFASIKIISVPENTNLVNLSDMVTVKYSKAGIVEHSFGTNGELHLVPKANGTTKLTVTAADGSKITADVTITVCNMIKSLSVSTDKTVICSGETAAFTAMDGDKKLTNTSVTWSLVNEADSLYAKIDAKKGTLKANNVTGTHVVKAIASTTDGSGLVSRELSITVMPKKLGNLAIMMNGEFIEGAVTVGSNAAARKLSAYTVEKDREKLTKVKWTSSAPKIAVIDANGNLSFTGQTGSVTITAQDISNTKLKTSASFKVQKFTDGFRIVPTKGTDMSVLTGKSLALKAVDSANKTVNCTWTTDAWASTYAKVSTSGSVSAQKTIPGKRYITVYATAKDGSGITEKASVLVRPAASAVTINYGGMDISGINLPVDLREMKTLRLDTKVYPEDSLQKVTWKTSNKKIADVDENGNISFLSTGAVTLTATSADGSNKSATVKFKVILSPDKMEVGNNPTVLAAGKSVNLSAVLSAAGYSNSQITEKGVIWTLEDGKVAATLTEKGALKANAVTGIHTLMISAVSVGNPELVKIIYIKVAPAITSIKLSKGTTDVTGKTIDMAVGGSVCINANILPALSCNEVVWSIKGTSASISNELHSSVLVTAEAKGKTTLTATAADGSGKKATLTINVK